MNGDRAVIHFRPVIHFTRRYSPVTHFTAGKLLIRALPQIGVHDDGEHDDEAVD